VDAIDFSDRGRKPGEVFEIDLDEIPPVKIDDFSMHQVPSSNMLHELHDAKGLEVVVLACQVVEIPEEVTGGLAPPLKEALPKMADLLEKYW
jgi:coenzyme F420 hydrogenase subunit delta